MSEAHARAWWADVEHLREAAERRSAERAKARIEGRDPVDLTPLRPLRAVDGLAVLDETLDDAQPFASGEAPSLRRFTRDGAAVAHAAYADPEPRTGTLTLVRDDEDPAAHHARVRESTPREHGSRQPVAHDPELRPVRFTRRRGDDGVSPRPRLRGSGRPPAAVPANGADPSRRTVEIRGTVVPMAVTLVPDQANDVGPARRRPARRPGERFIGSPDRVAAYAVMLGVLLIVVALLSAHGA